MTMSIETFTVYYCNVSYPLNVMEPKRWDETEGVIYAMCNLFIDTDKYGKPLETGTRMLFDGEFYSCLYTEKGFLALSGPWLPSIAYIPLDKPTVPARWFDRQVEPDRYIPPVKTRIRCEWTKRNFEITKDKYKIPKRIEPMTPVRSKKRKKQ